MLGGGLGGRGDSGRVGRRAAMPPSVRLQRCFERVDGGDQRVEQRLVAEDRAAALLDACGRGAQHGDDVLGFEHLFVAGGRGGAQKSGAPQRTRSAPDLTGDHQSDLLQEDAGAGAVEGVEVRQHLGKAARQRDSRNRRRPPRHPIG